MRYDADYTCKFYNAYGQSEWDRLESRPYGRLQAIIHDDFLTRYIQSGEKVLDAGCGPGRFAVTMAKLGAEVTLLDISDKQLELAENTIEKTGTLKNIKGFMQGDICNLSMFPDNSFDAVVCFGGALSYICEKGQTGARELIRVTRPAGTILVSVMSLLGAVLDVVNIPVVDMLSKPEEKIFGPAFWPVLETGDLSNVPSRRANMAHAPMHLYTAQELRELFRECEMIEAAGSNVTFKESFQGAEVLFANPAAWKTVVELERKLCRDPGLVNSGSHMIMVLRK